MQNIEEKTNKILHQDLSKIQILLKSGQLRICVVGIGRIGLPTALSFANSNLPTYGIDINENLVSMINSGNFPLKDEPGYDDIFQNVIKSKKFFATTKIEEVVPHADAILLSLPTPMDNNKNPNYSALESVGRKIHSLLTKDTVIIVESTVEPGYIENTFVKFLEGDDGKLVAGRDFGLGVCPETANPGEILKDFKSLPRLVGGIDDKTANIILEIYRHVFPIEIVKMPDCKTANAAKLTTNVFRYINIAFVNELAILCERLGIDIMKVLEAADMKYNFQVHYPGPGVGGPCLPVNSVQILHSAKLLGNNLLRMVSLSQEINDNMVLHVLDLVSEALKSVSKDLNKSTVLILGASYKPNVKDIQLTPAEPVIKKLQEKGATIKIYDPYFKSTMVFNIKTEDNLADAISNIDAVILITAHDEFRHIDPAFLGSKSKPLVVIDTRGIIDIHAARKAGLIIRGIGRGGK